MAALRWVPLAMVVLVAGPWLLSAVPPRITSIGETKTFPGYATRCHLPGGVMVPPGESWDTEDCRRGLCLKVLYYVYPVYKGCPKTEGKDGPSCRRQPDLSRPFPECCPASVCAAGH